MKVMIALALSAGCYQYDAPACAVACTTSADCPGAQACTPAGRCAESASASCGGTTEDGGPDAPPPLIRVTVTDERGAPAVGVRVIAATAAGAPIADVVSNTQGIATFETMVGVDVTVVRPTALGTTLTTILAAQPGDMLAFGRPRNEVPAEQRAIAWPAFAAADNYSIYASCGGGTSVNIGTTPSTTRTFEPACADDYDVLVSYFDIETNAQGYKIKTAASGNTTFPNDGWRSFTTENASFTALPASVQVAGTPWGGVSFTGGTVFRAPQIALGPIGIGPPIVGAATGASNITLPAQGVAQRELVTRATHNAETSAAQLVVERVGPTGTYSLALEPALLPWIIAAPALDLATRSVTWTRASAGPSARTTPDLVAVEIAYERGASNTMRNRWRLIGPPSAAVAIGGQGSPDQLRVTFPDLPGDLPFEPAATDTPGPGTPAVVRHYGFTAATAPTYASLRGTADVMLVMTSPLFMVADRFLASGDITRMVIVTYGQP